jgi:hypothetical protein
MSTALQRKQHDPLVTYHKHDPTSMAEGCPMATARVVIPGIVKNGMVVPQHATHFPEGAHVDMLIGPAGVTPALQAACDL